MKTVENLIYIIILLLPTYLIRFDIFSVPFTFLELLIIGTFIIFMIKAQAKFYLGWWKYPLALFIMTGLISTIVSPDTYSALGMLKAYIIEPVMLFLMILNVQPKLKKIIFSLALSALFISIVGLIQYFTGYGIPAPWDIRGPEFRITSIYEYPNAVGLYLTPIITLIFGYLYFSKSAKTKGVFLAVAFVLSLAAILMAQTDGAFLAIIGALVFYGLFTRWRYAILAAFFVAILISMFIPQTRDILLFQDTSGDVRLALWKGTSSLLMDQPLEGSGLGGFPIVYDEYRLDSHTELLLYPHNIFLNFWVQLGFLGLIWLLWILYKIFNTGLKNNNRENIILLGAFVSIIIYGLVDVPYFKNDLSVLFWLLLGMFTVINCKDFKLEVCSTKE
ncbi:MAG: O-antigen ligase family protein [Patescibacteria group bacterium]